jgi:hypothetical protein
MWRMAEKGVMGGEFPVRQFVDEWLGWWIGSGEAARPANRAGAALLLALALALA